jgi:hypothetical protein
MKTDGSEKIGLATAYEIEMLECWDLNVVGDWIYFRGFSLFSLYGYSRESYVCRIKTDGTQFEMLDDEDYNAAYVSVVGEYIYYGSPGLDDGSYIKRMRLDGSEKTVLWSTKKRSYLDEVFVFEDYIYFSGYEGRINQADTAFIKRIRLDGSEVETLAGESNTKTPGFYQIARIDNGWIYYGRSEYKKETKMRLDGTDKTRWDFYNEVNGYIIDGWVYDYYPHFNDYDDGGKYRIKPDGTQETLILDDAKWMPTTGIHGGWIYYHSQKGLHRIKVDGTGNELIMLRMVDGTGKEEISIGDFDWDNTNENTQSVPIPSENDRRENGGPSTPSSIHYPGASYRIALKEFSIPGHFSLYSSVEIPSNQITELVRDISMTRDGIPLVLGSIIHPYQGYLNSAGDYEYTIEFDSIKAQDGSDVYTIQDAGGGLKAWSFIKGTYLLKMKFDGQIIECSKTY